MNTEDNDTFICALGRVTVGLSLSTCIREVIEGGPMPDKIYSSTMCSSREDLVKVCKQYADWVWGSDWVKATEIALKLWDNGCLIQPRILGFNEGFGRVQGGFLETGHRLHPWGDKYIYEDEIPDFVCYLLNRGQLRFSSEYIVPIVEYGLRKDKAEHNIMKAKHNALRANYASLQEAYNDMRHGQTRLQALVEKRNREIWCLNADLNNANRDKDAANSDLNTLNSAYNTLKVNHETLKEELAQVKASRGFTADAWESTQVLLESTRAALKSAQEVIAEKNKKLSDLQADLDNQNGIIRCESIGYPVAIRAYRKLQEGLAELKEEYTKVCNHNAVLVSNAENNKGVLREYNRELQKARKELDTTVEALKSSRDRLSRYYVKYGIDF